MSTGAQHAATVPPVFRRPEPLDRRTRRVHLVVLALIAAGGLLHGLYWTIATVVWSPIDEVAHVGYVQSLAEGEGVPVIGQDRISDELLGVIKGSPTSSWRWEAFTPTNTDANWGGVREQYEASTAPIYYGAMALPYRIGAVGGLTGSIFAVRLATVLLALLTVPLTWALARRLMPDRPLVWLVAPALVVTANALVFGAVTNDALAVVLGELLVLLLARALQRGAPSWASALAGLALGLAVVGKPTILVLVPVLAFLVAWWWPSRDRAPVGRMVLLAGAGALVGALPWLAWTYATYHSFSAISAINDALPPADRAFSFARLGTDLQNAPTGLWANQMTRGLAYPAFWTVLTLGFAAAGAAVAAMRRARHDAIALVLCGLALPAALVMVQVLNYTIERGTGAPVGRHALPAVPFALIALAGGLVIVLGERWARVAVAGTIAVALLLESRMASDLLTRSYLAAVVDGDLAPVVQQDLSLRWAHPTLVRVDAPCPVEAVHLGFQGGYPPALPIQSADAGVTAPVELVSSARQLYDEPHPDTPLYRLPAPVRGPFTIEIPPGATLNATGDDRSAAIAMRPDDGDPVITVYCRETSSAAADLAYAHTFPPNHAIDAPMVVLDRALLVAAGVAFAATIALAVVAWRARDQSVTDEPGRPVPATSA